MSELIPPCPQVVPENFRCIQLPEHPNQLTETAAMIYNLPDEWKILGLAGFALAFLVGAKIRNRMLTQAPDEYIKSQLVP